MRSAPLAAGCLVVALTALSGWGRAATYHVERLASGFHLPVYATTAPGDDDRIFVVELGGLASDDTDGDPNTHSDGRIKIYSRLTGTVNTDPFLVIPDTDLTDPVAQEPEVGLWALAFHPDYQNNGRFFINVAVDNGGLPTEAPGPSPFSSTIREYSVSADPDVAIPSPSQTLLEVVQPAFNHNGSWMGFNPIPNAANDNKQYLYITLGDGGDQHDPRNNGQRRDELFGSVLRIDVDAAPDPGLNYHVPESNPFYGEAGMAQEIWNYGLRNPWQASFDRETGDLWIGDVGQGTREEIDFQPASSTGGENYGWRLREGAIATPTGGIGGAPPTDNVEPVYDYAHFGLGTPGFEGNSVAGGRLYRGPVEELQGLYIFSDSRSGEVWAFDPVDPYETVERLKLNPAFTPDAGVIDYVVSFGEDNQGNLLIVDYDGELYQVVANLGVIVTVDRDTGQMTFANSTGEITDIRGYSVTSDSGAIHSTNITPITGILDASGNGLIDPLHDWQITSSVGDKTEFSEESTAGASSTERAGASSTERAGASSTERAGSSSTPAEENLLVAASHIDLAAAEVELAGVVGREVILRDKLVEAADDFDFVLVDCPPSLGILTINALSAVDDVFLPLQPHFLALHGLSKLLQTIGLVADRLNGRLQLAGVVLCMYESGTRLAAEVSQDVDAFFREARKGGRAWQAVRLFETRVRRNIRLAEAPSFGRSIFDYAPNSPGAEDYRALGGEVLAYYAGRAILDQAAA